MKKFIFILNALDIMAGLLRGKRFEGVLFLDMNTGLPTFKAYNRKPRVRSKDVLIEKLPWGWVKGSAKRNKRLTSMPNDLSLAEQLAILDKENELAKEALIKKHLFNNEIL